MRSLHICQILPLKYHFLFAKKCKFCKTFCHKSRILPISSDFVKNKSFRHYSQFSSFRQFFIKNKILRSLVICYLSDVLYDMLWYIDTCHGMIRWYIDTWHDTWHAMIRWYSDTWHQWYMTCCDTVMCCVVSSRHAMIQWRVVWCLAGMLWYSDVLCDV